MARPGDRYSKNRREQESDNVNELQAWKRIRANHASHFMKKVEEVARADILAVEGRELMIT